MPQLDLYVPGDNVFPQYNVTQTVFVAQGVEIVKGRIYTMNAAYRLIVPVVATGVADLSRGIFQAQASITAPTDDISTVQVWGMRSRIALKAPSGVGPGTMVDIATPTATTITADKVKVVTISTGKGYLGRIFNVLAKDAYGNYKHITDADNQLVLVDLGAI